jgi:hypothetical protein
MSFRTDSGGMALEAEIKLSNKATTWNTRLDHISRHDRAVTLVTFSLCDYDYICRIVSKRERGAGITIICNSKYESNAYLIKRAFPDLKIYVNPYAHAKLALVEPGTVWLSSENLGKKKNTFDASIGIHSEEAYNHYYSQVQSLLRSRDTKEITEVC